MTAVTNLTPWPTCPACPGLEIPLLAEATGYQYPVVGIDLSPGMVAIANDLAKQHMQQQQQQPGHQGQQGQQGQAGPQGQAGLRCALSAVVGDALDLHSHWAGRAAIVFSSFGLQQLGPRAPEVSMRRRAQQQ